VGKRNAKKYSNDLRNTTEKESMRRSTGKGKVELEEHIKRKFTPEEDRMIRQMVGDGEAPSWSVISRSLVGRTARQCRERWRHYLQPHISMEAWSMEEDRLLKDAFERAGSRWSIIAQQFPGRTEVNVKNRWSILKRRAIRDRNRNGEQRRSKKNGQGVEPLPGIEEIIALGPGPLEPSVMPKFSTTFEKLIKKSEVVPREIGADYLKLAIARPNMD
jgi:hypothetical protein